jgi:hypothetical protein
MRRGFLLSYDMVFVPRESFAAALSPGGPPRAIPSDLAVAVASRLLPADLVQKLILLLIFLLACAGPPALLTEEPLLIRLTAGAYYAWNPYVAERLIIGQWALLLGYAGLPWALRAALHPALTTPRGTTRLALSLLPAILGGFAALSLTALTLTPAALRHPRTRRAAVILAALAVGSLPWLIPSALHPVYADPAGVAAFASRADTPFGTVGSLLMLGGAWNAQTVPKAYGGAWSVLWLAVTLTAITGYLAFARRRTGDPATASSSRWPGLGAAALAGLLIACIGTTAPGRALLLHATQLWPGFAVLRDAQQFIAPLALAEAVGLALILSRATSPRPARTPRDLPGVILGVVALLTPVLLLPGLAAGAAGRLRPAWYPPAWLAAARTIDASPAPGDVLLLPWATYRIPAWNHGEPILDPWPRLLSRPVIWNDGTKVGSVTMAPDDPRARQLAAIVTSGTPMTAALRASGVRFVVVDAPQTTPPPNLPGARLLTTAPGLTVYQLPN